MQIQSEFSRVLHVDLSSGLSRVLEHENRILHLGGSGLAASLYQHYGNPQSRFDDPSEPIIFAIGPLTGAFPLMSKCVCGFRSPYNEQWAESHAGGRLALSLRFSGYDALMLSGRAPSLSCLLVGAHTVELHDAAYLRGRDIATSGKFMRALGKSASGHRTSMRIGPSGENGVAYAGINVDSFRHFGRLGAGAVLGFKNLKGIVVMGDASYSLPQSKTYSALYRDIFQEVTTTDMMRKYHDMGTAENLAPLNKLKALPWRNLLATSDPNIDGITGERIADELLLRKTACSGCPVGCIHIGLLRQKFADDHEYLYKQVPYDYEPIFAQGSMLGITDAPNVLAVLDETERLGLDCMSAGVALAWATEAFQTGLISEKECLLPLEFGNANTYIMALRHISARTNEFWTALGQGTLAASKIYGGEDFACVLGQEMAGYATGEVFYVGQSMGFRHSHLDSGAYSYDQANHEPDVDKALNFLVSDEQSRVMLNCMVACMFARKIYKPARLQEALASLELHPLADNLELAATQTQNLRWKLKLQTGYQPETVRVPKRFYQVENWKGKINPEFMRALQTAYAQAIRKMGG